MKILGIDPGTSRIGFGLIETDGLPGQDLIGQGGLRLISYGTIEAKEKTLLGKIGGATAQFKKLIAELKPDYAAIEKIFFAKNQKTAMAVAQARGALLSILLEKEIPLMEFSPTEVKSQVAGYGLADKKGVAKIVKMILKLEELPGYDDASDALAIAIAAANQRRLLTRKIV